MNVVLLCFQWSECVVAENWIDGVSVLARPLVMTQSGRYISRKRLNILNIVDYQALKA
jgi:hypothetical protein